jgi:hypothetical protein
VLNDPFAHLQQQEEDELRGREQRQEGGPAKPRRRSSIVRPRPPSAAWS